MLNRVFILIKALPLLIVAIWAAVGPLSQQAHALTLPNRSVRLTTNIVSANANHDFQFTVPSTNAIGSIVFEYCDNTPIVTVACNAPPGLDMTAATLTTQTGNTGFIIHVPSLTANKIVLARSPAPGAAVPSNYVFSNATNPSDPNHTTYVRISTHVTANGSGSITDNGAVAFATVSPFAVNTFVPPFIRLCVGITVTINCSSAVGDSVDLGILSSSSTKTGISQFSVGTNSITGYVVSVIGTTMTSGNNSIPAINPAGLSGVGSSQFGINLVANTVPSVGQNPQGSGTGTPQSGYNTSNVFKLSSGDTIATSSLPSEFNLMTVSYIVNVSASQPAGIYNTTLTYVGTGQF